MGLHHAGQGAGRQLHAIILRAAETKFHRASLDRFARLFVSYADRLLAAD
jgi:hypothetical protein